MLSILLSFFKNQKVLATLIVFRERSISLQLYLLVFTSSFLVISSNVLAATCPETNTARIDFKRETRKNLLETSDGRKYVCWLDKGLPALRFQRVTYDVVFRCSKTIKIYSYLDDIEEVIIDRNGSKNLYQADFLGDKYECSSHGETMIKSWIYKRGADIIKQTDYYYTPYKW